MASTPSSPPERPPIRPWNPDPGWADPLLGVLLLLVSLLLVWEGASRRALKPSLIPSVGLEGRAQELRFAARVLGPLANRNPTPPSSWAAGSGASGSPVSGSPILGSAWDRAVQAVLEAEEGRRSTIDPELPEAFRKAHEAAYAGAPPPSLEERAMVRQGLGSGLAADLLEARLRAREGRDGEALRREALARVRPRLLLILGGGALAFLLALGGPFALVVSRRPPPPESPAPQSQSLPLPWRAVALVLLGWFVALRLSGLVAYLVLGLLDLPRAAALPIATLFHTSVGFHLLRRALGHSFRNLWRAACPLTWPRALGQGFAWLGVALGAVFFTGWLLGPLIRQLSRNEPPQRELLELLGGAHAPGMALLLFFTAAGLAPLFEEALFRGFLLPWLKGRLREGRSRWAAQALALALSSLAFGAMHLQPAALPTLSALGFVMGWAFLRTGDLRVPLVVHAAWNGGMFLFLRLL